MVPDLEILSAIERRLLWLSTLIVHHANHVRPNLDGVKVGGHQASSASVISILTALYFGYLRPGDRVSIKPHASPAFHALQYLLGQLPPSALTQLREFGGLQAYPSRTKDLDPVDFSTGSVGFGAVAPAFAALANQYLLSRGAAGARPRRFVALIGDAELDEGNVWEALLDEALSGLTNVLWVVDLNRQSLDRVVPGIRMARLRRLFAEIGWRVLDVKYGRRLQAAFARPGGAALRRRVDEMSNEEYQALIRLPGAELRAQLARGSARRAAAIKRVLTDVPDSDLPALLADLGGHDLAELLSVFQACAQDPASPTVVLAYTIKGWRLPFAGHPLNHSMLLTAEQIAALGAELGIAPGAEWERFAIDSPAGQACQAVAERLFAPEQRSPATVPVSVPEGVLGPVPDTTSTQDMFGRLLTRLADHPELRPYLVTCSPDVSISTSLAGWINKAGVYAPEEAVDYEAETQRLMRWAQRPSGQHIELGISEMNLFTLLGMLGLSAELCGQALVPIGTVYDPFICRGLDALIYSLYSGAKFIFAGTPSGITLSREGGAHQSTITPSIGLELPQLQCYEPAYGQELEWILLDAIQRCLDRRYGLSTYLRLTTRPVDQRPFARALARHGQAALRRQALAGGYCLLDRADAPPSAQPALGPDAPAVIIAAVGAVVPEVIAAAETLWEEGVAVSVLNLTSPRRLFEAWRAGAEALAGLIPPEARRAPILTVQDGAAHGLAWLGSVYGAPVTPLGVDAFGQSGARSDLYHHFGLDANSIIEAAFTAVDRMS
jgi:pyruvate dehydrogenase E1 component